MYQTFLATRILADGGRLLGIADTVVLKDIQIEGEQVGLVRATGTRGWSD